MLSEIKVVLRGLLKSPGFTIIAIATLALAIGANSAVFSLINALLVRPLPYQQPSRLALVWERIAAQGLDRIPVSPPEYLDLEKAFKSGSQLATFTYQTFNFGGGDVPERISGALVTPTLFPLLGVEPIKGRTFAREEQGKGHDDMIVISERLWQRRFNSDSSMISKSLLLNGRSYTVIGIMPAKFEFPIPLFGVQGNQFAERVDIWKPVAFTATELKDRGNRSYGLITRLRADVSPVKAQAELDTIMAGWIRAYPDNYKDSGFGARIYPLQDQVVGRMRTGLAILLGAVIFVLLIACANLATMLLARASVRERDLAIRIALGAGRWRLLRQMLTESVLLALAGAAGGVVLSIWGLELLKQIGARTVPRLAEVNVDLVVLIVTAVVAVGTGILFGLVPAFASAKPELTEALKEGGRTSTTGARRNQLRNSLVVAEIALALVLLVGAGLLLKSYARVQNIDPGFDRRNVLTAEIKLPGVEHASISSIVPFGMFELTRKVQRAGLRLAPDAKPATAADGLAFEAAWNSVGADYFPTVGLPVVRGRAFTESEATQPGPKVAVIDEVLAKKLWPDGDALGQRIQYAARNAPSAQGSGGGHVGSSADVSEEEKQGETIEIVGIVPATRHALVEKEPAGGIDLPFARGCQSDISFFIRFRSLAFGNEAATADLLRRSVHDVDPSIPIISLRTFAQHLDSNLDLWLVRAGAALFSIFGGLALSLAVVGLYGVKAYSVARRTREIGRSEEHT